MRGNGIAWSAKAKRYSHEFPWDDGIRKKIVYSGVYTYIVYRARCAVCYPVPKNVSPSDWTQSLLPTLFIKCTFNFFAGTIVYHPHRHDPNLLEIHWDKPYPGNGTITTPRNLSNNKALENLLFFITHTSQIRFHQFILLNILNVCFTLFLFDLFYKRLQDKQIYLKKIIFKMIFRKIFKK